MFQVDIPYRSALRQRNRKESHWDAPPYFGRKILVSMYLYSYGGGSWVRNAHGPWCALSDANLAANGQGTFDSTDVSTSLSHLYEENGAKLDVRRTAVPAADLVIRRSCQFMFVMATRPTRVKLLSSCKINLL